MPLREVGLPANQPTLRVTINNQFVSGVVFLQVDSDGYFSADRFRIGLSIGSSALNTISYFVSLGMKTIEIEISTNGLGFISIITGQIDNINLELCKNIAILTGRSLAARLIDNEISETFSNQTASQIAELIATRNQLIPNVTSTSTTVGQYYELDHARTSLGLNSRSATEWNLLSSLAKDENFVLSVFGLTLNFGPQNSNSPVLLSPKNFVSLDFDVAATLPKNVTVKSWNSRNKISAVQSSGEFNGNATTIIRPNLSSQKCLRLASNHLSILNQHYTILMGTLPGELSLMPGMQIILSGTDSSLDRTYYVSIVRRMLDDKAGFIEMIQAYSLN